MSEQRTAHGGPRPLDGVRVLSFGTFVAGGTAGGHLAELGADVVKIEAFDRPEVLRLPSFAIGPTFTEQSGAPQTVMYGTLTRNVRNLSIDMRQEAARTLFHELVKGADVLIENFAGPTLARWGCSFEDLLVDNPRLVWVSLSGYGRTGPRANYLAYASNIAGYIGLTSAWGYSHGTQSDYVTGVTASLGAVGALAEVERTGAGVYVDVAQIDAMATLMAPLYAEPLNNGRDYERADNVVPGSWFTGVFQCLGHDAWLAIELEDHDDWSTLCRFLERPDLEVADQAEAGERSGELEVELLVWLAQYTNHTGAHLLQKAGLAASAVHDSEDIWRDPQLRVRGYHVRLDQPTYGVVTYPGPIQHLSRTPGRLDTAGAMLGEHTHEILREWVTVSDADLASLESTGAIFQAPEQE
ncbi:MAG: CoA transferase [Acidobacteria bacterium]|nr:CoA transferase [Acidobacteriota bacterium]